MQWQGDLHRCSSHFAELAGSLAWGPALSVWDLVACLAPVPFGFLSYVEKEAALSPPQPRGNLGAVSSCIRYRPVMVLPFVL